MSNWDRAGLRLDPSNRNRNRGSSLAPGQRQRSGIHEGNFPIESQPPIPEVEIRVLRLILILVWHTLVDSSCSWQT